MTALNKCLLYVFLCVAIFCEIDSKGQIPNDGVINIDDTLKGEVIEGSGRGFEDDVDQEEASGGLEDDEDTPLLSSSVPQRGRSPTGRQTDSTFFEFGSGDHGGRQEVSKPPTTHFKPRKPDPTNFVTRYTPDKKNEFDDEKNKINEDGGTGYDEKDRNDDDYMNNNIPMIEKSVMGPKQQKHDSSLWKQPGILAGIIGAAVVGLLCAVLLVMFIVYRMRKKDEGSYDLDETTKRSPRINGYQRTNQNEFYA